jgi:hypothetical protein
VYRAAALPEGVLLRRAADVLVRAEAEAVRAASDNQNSEESER